MKIIIEVSGGVVQAVYSTDIETTVSIIDWDEARGCDSVAQEKALRDEFGKILEETKTMHEIAW